MGAVCAAFWAALVGYGIGPEVFARPGGIVVLIAGGLLLIGMGAYFGGRFESSRFGHGARSREDGEEDLSETALKQVHEELVRFDDWLSDHRELVDPWPDFEEFLRSMLYRTCHAGRLRVYVRRGEELVPLRAADTVVDMEPIPAREGIIGHVLTSGRSYVRGAPEQGELVEELAAKHGGSIAWCFPIVEQGRSVGVVVVGRLGIEPLRHRTVLAVVEALAGRFWCSLADAVRSRDAVQHDPVSGLPIRPAFLRSAAQAMAEANREHEPVVMAVFSLEGLRRLGDAGRWESADALIQEVSAVLKRKVRSDDRVGRFDSSRFIVLLRRVDSALGSLIVRQLLERLQAVCGDASRWGQAVQVRCGMAGSGAEPAELEPLVTQALSRCSEARAEDRVLVSDVGAPETTVEAVGT